MLYKVKDNQDFKNKNLENWYANSEFWLQSKMRHLKDVYGFTGEILSKNIEELNLDRKINVLDLGCGEGWIYRLLKESTLEVDYTGLDFNKIFIEANLKRYDHDGGRFILYDLENPPPNELLNYADLAINFFNFFEIPNIRLAFSNVAKMIRKDGILIIVNIDPIMQILSVSESFDDFKNSLKEYENFQAQLAYDKDIDVGDEKSGRIYKSLLYSTATYVEFAKENGLQLFDYKEVVKTGNFVPQIYQYIFFKK